MLIVAGTVTIHLPDRDALIEAAEHMMQSSREEPGCLAYKITADLSDPSQFHIFEKWQDQAALDAHFQTPHMTAFQDVIAGKVTQMNIEQYHATALHTE